MEKFCEEPKMQCLRRIFYFSVFVFLLPVCPTGWAAGSPTAVSNLPVVTADRHKTKQKKGEGDSKAGKKDSQGKAAEKK